MKTTLYLTVALISIALLIQAVSKKWENTATNCVAKFDKFVAAVEKQNKARQ